MKALIIPPVSQPPDSKCRRSYWCSVFPAASFLFLIIFAVYAFLAPDYKEKLSRWEIADTFQNFKFSDCKNRCRPPGSESLPEGIVSKTSNFQMRPLWGLPKNEDNSSINLLAVAVGIKQRDLVNKMVKKFLSSNFSVMLFHYDGIVDEWRDFEWNDRVIHVSARNQTKWYVSIVKSEGLHISQPALDYKSLVHQQITVRASKSGVHRRTYKPGLCDANSTAPPCTGWVEMMAPVFSRAAWRCVWYMIQNDLIHAWGLDYLLGYCSQGDRTKNIGIVDAEYIAHYGFPTLGGVVENQVPSRSQKTDPRLEVRRQSLIELKVFQKRWKEAVEEDQCWIDPYKEAAKESS